MSDTKDNLNSDQLDIEAYEDLMELVFAYSAAAHDFGFTHKMNNRFTSLSMNASFLKQALENQDYDKAASKAAQVSESIKGLVNFSQNLMNTDLIPRETETLEFPGMISDTLGKLLRLSTFSDIKLNQDLDAAELQTKANPKIVWIFLFAFLKHAKRYTTDGPIQLITVFDVEHNQYIIKTDVNQILNGPAVESEVSSLAFPSAGEMPMRYLARVIRNVSSKFELIHHAERPLSLELKINLATNS